jgi:predicted nucleic acid-binding protein
MQAVANGEQSALQPPHWLAEVGAELARESPATAAEDMELLQALELPSANDPPGIRRAVELAIELKQHVFDTWYHAIALQTADAILVTADRRYLRAAREKGRIVDLMKWR